jgi:hypothetical protein
MPAGTPLPWRCAGRMGAFYGRVQAAWPQVRQRLLRRAAGWPTACVRLELELCLRVRRRAWRGVVSQIAQSRAAGVDRRLMCLHMHVLPMGGFHMRTRRRKPVAGAGGARASRHGRISDLTLASLTLNRRLTGGETLAVSGGAGR